MSNEYKRGLPLNNLERTKLAASTPLWSIQDARTLFQTPLPRLSTSIGVSPSFVSICPPQPAPYPLSLSPSSSLSPSPFLSPLLSPSVHADVLPLSLALAPGKLFPSFSNPFSVVTGIKAMSRLHSCRAILYALMSAHVVACMPARPSGTREFYPAMSVAGKPVRNISGWWLSPA